MLTPDRKALVVRFAIRLPNWLPDWNYWALIPAAILVAIAIAGSWPATRTASQYGGAQASAQAANGSNKVVRPETPDERLADYTGALAIFTAALVALAVLEVFFLAKTDAIAKRHADNAEKQMLLAAGQHDLAGRQHRLAREQFFAANRPRLVLKDVYFDLEGRLTFEIANIGGMPATITDGWAALGHVDDDRWFKLRDHGELRIENLKSRHLDTGELKTIAWTDTTEIAARYLTPIKFLGKGPSNLFFYGAFHYIDDRGAEFGTERLAVFRRQWHLTEEAFLRTGGPDHEYSD